MPVRGAQGRDTRIAFETDGFSVVVVRQPGTGRWLAVQETQDRGWWLPAGHVDRGQTFIDAAHAETSEEAGIQVVLKGILAVEHSLSSPESARMRVVFYAEPVDPAQKPKAVADSESLGAAWMTVEDLQAKSRAPLPQGLRGRELLHWARYIEAGGPISPIEMLQQEEDGPSEALRHLVKPGLNTASSTSSVTMSAGIEVGMTSPADLATIVEGGDLGRLRQALLAGVDVKGCINAKQWTLLHLAVASSDVKMVQLLLLAGAPTECRTHRGRTPLHFAATRSSAEVVRCLLLAGADPTLADNDGKSCAEACPPDALDVLAALNR